MVTLKVLMASPSFYPILGGVETAVMNLATELNRKGIRTDVMTFNMERKWRPFWKGKTEISPCGFEIIKIPALNWFPLTDSDKIKMRVKLFPGRFLNYLSGYDIVHFHDGDDLSLALFSYLTNIPKILHLHGLPTVPLYYRRYSLSRYIFRKLADLYIALNKTVESDIINIGIPKAKIRHLPNGIDTEEYCPSGKKEENLLLFVGRMTRIKGVHILLRSLKYLEQPVSLVLIGPPGYGFDEISSLIKEESEKKTHDVRYLGILKTEEVIRWYQKASIFVCPSLSEPFGIVNLEALSCQTPVIASNVEGIPEVVRSNKEGILVPPNHPARLAEAIQHLLSNEGIRRRFGVNGRRRAVNCFSLEAVTERLVRIYEEVLD